MPSDSPKDVDPTDEEHRELGSGLFEESMSPGSSVAHLYRGEVHRMRFWRERLDRTTYWAIVVVSAILTWTFTSHDNPHYLLLLGVVAVTAFLMVEARRFQGYDIWRSRVRTLQRNVFAYGLDPSAGLADPEWREHLSRDYRRPTSRVSTEEAIAHRLRRVYLFLFAIVIGAWTVRVAVFAGRPWPASAAVGQIPGVAVTLAVAAFTLACVVVGLRPREWAAEEELHSTRDHQRR